MLCRGTFCIHFFIRKFRFFYDVALNRLVEIKYNLFLTRKPVSRSVTKPSMRENRSSGIPTRSDTNQAVQAQKMARSLKFRI